MYQMIRARVIKFADVLITASPLLRETELFFRVSFSFARLWLPAIHSKCAQPVNPRPNIVLSSATRIIESRDGDDEEPSLNGHAIDREVPENKMEK